MKTIFNVKKTKNFTNIYSKFEANQNKLSLNYINFSTYLFIKKLYFFKNQILRIEDINYNLFNWKSKFQIYFKTGI